MRRTEFLITEVRNSTDHVDTNGVKDAEIIAYLNYAQKLIQNIIFKVNPKADIFKKKVSYAYSSNGEYTLPSDIFAQNAIERVEYKSGEQYFPMDRIDPSETWKSGYYTEDKTLVVVGYKNFDVRVTCFRKLPRMDKRWGKIASIADPNIVLDAGYDEKFIEIDDYLTVVNAIGAQVSPGKLILSFASGTVVLDSTAGISAGEYICSGANAVNASELPDDCETYLLDYVRQRLLTRNNYEDGGKQAGFTEKQETDISSLFANNQKDVLYPPITDYDSLDF